MVANLKEKLKELSQALDLDARKAILKKKNYNYRLKKERTLGLAWIIRALNDSDLGCQVRRVKTKNLHSDWQDRVNNDRPEFADIEGVTKEGKAIFIYVLRQCRNVKIAKRTCEHLKHMEKFTPHIGVAYDYWDCYDIVRGGKRKPRTYYYKSREKKKYG